MTNAIKGTNNRQSASNSVQPPHQPFSRFGKGPQFGFSKIRVPKGQFKPPAPRITQNKGGGGK